jgi:hypothetical protein
MLGSGSIDDVFLILVFKAVTLTPQVTLLPGKFTSCLLDRRLGELQAGLESVQKRKSHTL